MRNQIERLETLAAIFFALFSQWERLLQLRRLRVFRPVLNNSTTAIDRLG